jgi:hypothetical protein
MRRTAAEMELQITGLAGVNNLQDSTQLRGPVVGNPSGVAECVDISNFDIDDKYGATTRQGKGLVYAGTPHSLDPHGSGYFVEGTFKLLLPDYTAVSLCSLSDSTSPMSYAPVNYLTVCSNGVDLFMAQSGAIMQFLVPTLPHKVPILPAQIVAFYKRRLYYAVGQTLYPSDADNIEQSDTRDKPLKFNANINMVMPLDNGIWVGADKIYWLAGRTFEDFSIPGDGYNGVAVKGTDRVFDGSLIGGSGKVGIFTSNDGICLCFDNGQIQNMTLNQIGYTAQTKGSALIRKSNGLNQYISWV